MRTFFLSLWYSRDLLEAVRQILYASDGCVGHRECVHSMEPWRRARTLLYRIDR
jgi:hypothetical protein